jgi:hypothetical protein
MPKTARPDVLRDLVHLVRVPEEGGYDVGDFLAVNAEALAPLLGTTAGDLAASRLLPDGQVVARLRTRLERACQRDQEGRGRQQEAEAHAAAEQLAAAVRWKGDRALLTPGLLFFKALWAVPQKHAVLVADDFEVLVRRDLVNRARTLLPKLPEVAAFADREGLHIRWRGGHGQLNLCSRNVSRDERAAAIVIALPSPRPVQRRDVPQLPMLLGDVLVELGFG